MGKKVKTKHHLFFPRKRFPDQAYRKFWVMLPAHYHQAFHYFFDHHCMNYRKRGCVEKSCQYERICCYRGNEVI